MWGQKNTMSSEEGKNRTGVSHRPYDEAFKRAAVAQWQSGVPASRMAEGLGVCLPTAQESAAEVRRLRAQLQSVTNQRDILKEAVGIFAGPNADQPELINQQPGAALSTKPGQSPIPILANLKTQSALAFLPEIG